MLDNQKKPYVIYVAEIIYTKVSKIIEENPNISNIDAIERFIGSEFYIELSSGTFHNNWFSELKKNNFLDKETGKKIPDETLKLLEIQRDTFIKLLKTPDLYYAKSTYPLEISQNIFNLLWRMCESYELWCKETKQVNNLKLNLII